MTKSLLLSGREQSIYQRPHRKSGVSPFIVDCVRYDFNGDNFGPVQDNISIKEYDDYRKVTDLDVYPIDFAENAALLKDTLVKRGRQFAAHREFKHKRYSGLSLGEVQEEVSIYFYR